MDHEQVWQRWWQRHPESWQPWRSFLKTLFGLPMDEDDLALYRQCTGRSVPPVGVSSEVWLCIGRRGGKSMVLALIAVYLAAFRDWAPYLAPGEPGVIKIMAVDRRQARTCHRYCRALMMEVPSLAALVIREDSNIIELSTGIVIEVATASFRGIRGATVIAALCDELAFWRTDDAANPDSEILQALRPSMASVPGSMLLCASSPYARRGELWNAHKRFFGKDDAPALVWQAATRVMNPSIPQRVIDEAYERDPQSAAAEYGAEFRSDIDTFVSREVVEAAVAPGVFELPYLSEHSYVAFCDPSGGSSDSMTLAIAHNENDRAIIDAVRERRPPFSPEDVVQEFSDLLKSYQVFSVVGDRYGGEWPRERFKEHNITYDPAAKPKSDLYRELLPLLNSRRVELPDIPRLVAQLCSLERRTARGGRDSIDHSPGQHDDLANVAAGVLVDAIKGDSAGEIWRRLAD
jgi:hypothetical protein